MQATCQSGNSAHLIDAKGVETTRRELRFARHHILRAADCVFWRLLRRTVVRTLNAELLHSIAQRVGIQVEDFRRPLRPLDHSGRQLEGGQDMTSLYLFQSGKP
jgi:hypothetical protein